MTARAVTLEITAIRSRTRRLVGVSAAMHAALLLSMSFLPTPAPPLEGVTEITWVEATPALPEPAPTVRESRAVATEARAETLPAPQEAKEHFEREMPLAEIAPQPQDVAAVQDKLRERLASLQNARDQRNTIATLAAPKVSDQPVPASLPAVKTPHPEALSRGTSPAAAPTELTRTAPAATAPAPALSRLQPPSVATRAAPTVNGSADVREVLAGVTLAGPVADRPLVRHRLPEYPDWAKREAVEGSVRVYFEVLPNGHVKENVLVERTSGFQDFDRNALVALLDWRFEPLASGVTGEQWGSITLNYRLGN